MIEEHRKTFFLLINQYSDGSGMEPVRLYTKKDRAEEDVMLLKKHGEGGCAWVIEEVELFE